MSLVTRGMGPGPLATSGMGWTLLRVDKFGNVDFVIRVLARPWTAATDGPSFASSIRAEDWAATAERVGWSTSVTPVPYDVAPIDVFAVSIFEGGWTVHINTQTWRASSIGPTWSIGADERIRRASVGKRTLATTVRRPV